jgi:hypothetical protein
MRIRVVGRKQGNTSKEVGAAVATAVGAIKAGKHKGVIKGKCLWLYNRFTNIATIKLMLGSSPKLIVKLDIEEYKYTDIGAVLAAATKLYKDDEVSQFTSSAMYTNIKAISDARFLAYIDKDAIANIFTAMCEAIAAEATIPQTSEFNAYGEAIYYNGDVTTDNTFRTAMDMPGLRTSITRFVWFTNSAVSAADTTVIQDVYNCMVSSLAEAAAEDWTDAYTAAINRVIAAISTVKDSVPAYFAALQTQYATVPIANIGVGARELREAVLALPSDIDIGVSADTIYRMFGVITVATVVEVCAPYVNKAIGTYNRVYTGHTGDKTLWWTLFIEGAIDYTAAFGHVCPTVAVETVTNTATVYVDGAVAIRVHTVPAVKYIMRYATSIRRSLTDNGTTYEGDKYNGSSSYSTSGHSSVAVDGIGPCALLVNITGADISEELQINSSTQDTEVYTDHDTSIIAPTGAMSSGTSRYVYTNITDGEGTCITAVRIPCKGIYAYGAGFPVSTDIQWATRETGDMLNSDDASSYGPNLRHHSMDDTVTVAAAATPAYNAYPLLIGTVHRLGAIPVTTTGEFTNTAKGTGAGVLSTINNTAAFSISAVVGGVRVGSDTLRSNTDIDVTDGVATRTRYDTVSSTATMSVGAEHHTEDVYKVLLATDRAHGYEGEELIEYDPRLGTKGGAMPWYPDIGYISRGTKVFNTDYGVRYNLGIDAQSIAHTAEDISTADAVLSSGGATTQSADVAVTFKTILNAEPMFTDGEYGPETAVYSGKATIIDTTGGAIYSAYIIDVISEAVHSGYAMRAADYIQLFIPDPKPSNGATTTPIVNPPDIPLLIVPTYYTVVSAGGADHSGGTYTKTDTPSTYTPDKAPEPIRNYNKLLRSPEFLVLNALMREEYTDTSVTPPATKRVPTFVPLSEAVQYMSLQGEGTPAPTLDVGYIQPVLADAAGGVERVKERVNSNIATKLQELENKYLVTNPDAPVDEEMHKRFTPAAIEAVIEEQLFTPIRGILPAHTEVKTTAVKPVGASADSTAEPMDIEYVLSVVSRGIGTYVDLGVLV